MTRNGRRAPTRRRGRERHLRRLRQRREGQPPTARCRPAHPPQRRHAEITRLDRLGRSVLHLVTLGAELRERGVGLQVIEQGIDTTTAEGRAMFGMLSVLAELQRELIIANTWDGLAAARGRGRKGGRRPRLNVEQVAHAQQLYDTGERTVQQIADLLSVPCTTIYGHLDPESKGKRPAAQGTRNSPASVATS